VDIKDVKTDIIYNMHEIAYISMVHIPTGRYVSATKPSILGGSLFMIKKRVLRELESIVGEE